MEPKNKEIDKDIDTRKTEITTGDKETYGDASDLDVTHYMGNNENIPRERSPDEPSDEEKENIGRIAYGNVDSSNEKSTSL